MDSAPLSVHQQLLNAAFDGDLTAVRAALAAGADVATRDERGEPPLLIAMRGRHVAVVKELLTAGAAVDCHDEFHNQPLHYAATYGLTDAVDALLDAGATINTPNQFGRTPLHIAADWERPETVRRLLESGADRNLLDAEGLKPGQDSKNAAIREALELSPNWSATISGFWSALVTRSKAAGHSALRG